MLECPTAIENVDFDPTELETAPEEPSAAEEIQQYESSRDYSANAAMERLDSIMDDNIVGGAIYGAAYSARSHGHILPFSNDKMRDVLVARLGALSSDERAKIASAVGTLRFEEKHTTDSQENFRLRDEAGAEIASILFPEIQSTGEAQYALSGDLGALVGEEMGVPSSTETHEGQHSSVMSYLERGNNVVSDELYGRLYEGSMYGNIPRFEAGTEDQIILARLQVLSEDAAQREKLDDLTGQLEEPDRDKVEVARALGQLLFPTN